MHASLILSRRYTGMKTRRRIRPTSASLPFLILFTAVFIAGSVSVVHAQDEEHKWNFNIGGGIGFPLGDLSSFINTGGHFVVGGGYNIDKYVSMNGEFMWH